MHQQSGLRRALPLILLAGSLAVPAAVVGIYFYQEGRQAGARSQAFADLSQCLFGEIVPSHEETTAKLARLQARSVHLSNDARWPVGGEPWPQRCASHGKDMMDAVRASSLMDETPKDELLKELDLLVKELEHPHAQTAYLPRAVLSVWKKAAIGEVAVGGSSSVTGPPRAVPMEGDAASAELPFVNIEHVPGGPAWHFIGHRAAGPSTDRATIGSCAPTTDGLSCHEVQPDGSLDPRGTWDSPAFIAMSDDGALKLLSGDKLLDTSPDYSGATQVHVDDRGTVYAMNMVSVPRKKKKKKKKEAEGDDEGEGELEKAPDTGAPIEDLRVHLLVKPVGKDVIRLTWSRGWRRSSPIRASSWRS